MYYTSSESCVEGAVTAVGFILNSKVLCWQSVFEVGTSCTIQNQRILQFLPFGGNLENVK